MRRVAEALREAALRLEAVSDTGRLDAELLMAEAMRTTRSELLLRHQHDTPPEAFEAFVARRLRHEPVAQIVGHKEFYGRDFVVGRDVLTPRADSETTVAAALDVCAQDARVLDCGVGSGALLFTVLAERPMASGIGIDRSGRALAVAGENASRLGLTHRVCLMERDWTKTGWQEGLRQFDLVIANPPYVETSFELAPSVRDYEPAGALYAGPEGLDDYRVLMPQLPGLLRPNGVALLEIGAAQGEAVSAIAGENGFASTLRHDLGGRPRALALRKTRD
jgi:release factor glutamine methyltransferase